ncbi:ABC transporter permease [Amycolatopsis alkalitolerans]|uniref:ABC transporter permease n=1 Tax=Amycolatopsis alkalitolerans TaxID=2547244 RepID=A0A5C4LQ02_9PSEU|nr:ABC transporter permease [Amycolatopsis alkalitolerans]TNC20230.1 ABC transporter permease [Amycolatopsis alkalitolerans]
MSTLMTSHDQLGRDLVRRAPGPAELDPKRHARSRRIAGLILAWATPVLLVAAWEVSARFGSLDTRFFPAPSTIWQAGVRSIQDGTMTGAITATVRSLLIGYGAGVASGVALGVLLGLSWVARSALEHTLVALYTLPKLALFPVFLLVFGLGSTPQIVLVAVSVFFIVVLASTTAVISVEQGYRDAAAVFGAKRMQLLRHVIIPAALPAIATAIRLTAGIAILVIVGIEMVSGDRGLGYLIFQRSQVFDPGTMYAGVVIAGLIGVAFTGLVSFALKFAIPQQRPRFRHS